MPLAKELQTLLLQRSVLHADETPIQQLTQKNKTIVEDAKTTYLWAYCTSDIDSQGPHPPIILFDCQPGRHGEHAKPFLDNFSGHLMVDDYAGYKKLFILSMRQQQSANLIISCMLTEHFNDNAESLYMRRSAEILNSYGLMIRLVPASPKHWGIEDDIVGH